MQGGGALPGCAPKSATAEVRSNRKQRVRQQHRRLHPLLSGQAQRQRLLDAQARAARASLTAAALCAPPPCPQVNGVPVRVTWRYLEDGSKVRVTVGHRSSASVVSRPEVLLQRRKPRNASSGPNDTTNEVAGEVTHTPGDLPSFLKQQLAEVAAAQQRPATQQQQQQRQYSTAAGGGSSSAGGLLGVAARLLGGARTQPLGSGGLWRGFAAGSLW